MPEGASGWKLDLTGDGAVLTESVTANGAILFTTHEAAASVDGAACDAGGSNRVYVVRVESGDAALDLNGDMQITQADRSAELAQTGIAIEPRIELGIPALPVPGLPSTPAVPGTPGASGGAAAPAQSRCTIGAELMNQCIPIDTVIRTYWKRTFVN